MVRYLTTNGKTDTYSRYEPFTLRYRRVNGTFYESIKLASVREEGIVPGPGRGGKARSLPNYFGSVGRSAPCHSFQPPFKA